MLHAAEKIPKGASGKLRTCLLSETKHLVGTCPVDRHDESVPPPAWKFVCIVSTFSTVAAGLGLFAVAGSRCGGCGVVVGSVGESG